MSHAILSPPGISVARQRTRLSADSALSSPRTCSLRGWLTGSGLHADVLAWAALAVRTLLWFVKRVGVGFQAYISPRSSAATILGDLGSGARPLTHGFLDDLGPSKPVEHLRSVLVATGALPDRDEQLARLERWISDTVGTVTDPEHRNLVRHYAAWHLLRRLRTRNHGRPVTSGQATGIRHRLRGAIAILDWLTSQQLDLDTCTQSDIDRWLADPSSGYRAPASGFLRWVTRNKLVDAALEGIGGSWQGPAELLDGEER